VQDVFYRLVAAVTYRRLTKMLLTRHYEEHGLYHRLSLPPQPRLKIHKKFIRFFGSSSTLYGQ